MRLNAGYGLNTGSNTSTNTSCMRRAAAGGGGGGAGTWGACMVGCSTHRYVMPRLLSSRTFSLFLKAGCPAAAATTPFPLVEGPSSSTGAAGGCFRCCFAFCCLLPPSSAAGAAALRFAILPAAATELGAPPVCLECLVRRAV